MNKKVAVALAAAVFTATVAPVVA
ncbi:MAG: hypothetical protein RL381_437, partial [Actinomycetota bacterium]